MMSTSARYSATPLSKKLGIKDHHQLLIQGAPDYFRLLLEPLPEDVLFTSEISSQTDMVHIFSVQKKTLENELQRLCGVIKNNAVIWVSWPKKASKTPTDITEDIIRELALPLGFVDIKVCAIDQVWSGLKLVIRRALRTAADS